MFSKLMFLTVLLLTLLLTLTTSSEDAEWIKDVSEAEIEQLPQAQALVNGEHSDLGIFH